MIDVPYETLELVDYVLKRKMHQPNNFQFALSEIEYHPCNWPTGKQLDKILTKHPWIVNRILQKSDGDRVSQKTTRKIARRIETLQKTSLLWLNSLANTVQTINIDAQKELDKILETPLFNCYEENGGDKDDLLYMLLDLEERYGICAMDIINNPTKRIVLTEEPYIENDINEVLFLFKLSKFDA